MSTLRHSIARACRSGLSCAVSAFGIVGPLAAAQYAFGAEGADRPRTTQEQQNESLDEVTVFAKRLTEGSIGGWIPTALNEAPRTIAILDEKTLETQMVSNAKDILKNIPGLQLLADGGTQGLQELRIRGIGTPQYTEGMYTNGVASSFAEFIGSVEVLEGYNAIQFGSSSGGAVNYHFKRPQPNAFTDVDLRGTSWGGYKVTVDTNVPIGDRETDGVRAVAVYDNDESFQRNFPERRRTAIGLAATYSGFFDTRLDVDVSTWDVTNDRSNQFYSISGTPTVPIPDLDPRVNVGQSWLESGRKGYQYGLKLSRYFGENWKVSLSRAVDRHVYRNDGCFVSGVDFATGEGSYSCSASTFGPLWDQETRLDIYGNFSTGPMQHALAFGVRRSGQNWESYNPFYGYFRDENGTRLPPQDFQNIYSPRRYEPTNSVYLEPSDKFDSTFTDTVYYIQDRISFGSKVDFWVGASSFLNDGWYSFLDDNGQRIRNFPIDTDDAISPTASIVYKPSPRQTYYATYAEGITRAEQIGIDPLVVNSGEIVKARHLKGYDIGAKWMLAPRFQLGLAVFRQQEPFSFREDAGNGMFRVVVGGLNEYTGVDIHFDGEVSSSWQLQGGITFLRPIQEETAPDRQALQGNYSPGVAHRMATLNVGYSPSSLPGLTTNLGLYYQSSPYLNDTNTYRTPGFTRVDGGASYESGGWGGAPITYRLWVENLLDERFVYAGNGPGVQPAAPRTVKVGVSMRFE